MFEKIIYNDKQTNYNELDLTPYNNKHIKLFVSNKTDDDMYNHFVEKLYNKINVHELNIIEDNIDLNSTVREDILEQGEDTLTFLRNYIDQIETDVDKQKLKEFAKDLYIEASE